MFLKYLLFRFFTFPLQFLPYSLLHHLGSFLGLFIFYTYPKYRKRALSNLALATDLRLTPDQIVQTARRSLQSLAITALEYPRLSQDDKIDRLATCENPEVASRFIAEKQGVIFFCGHQANWEILFLEGTFRMPGIAIGRPIKNPYLYRFVNKMREKFGGKIVPPAQATKACLRALKEGKFVGIVGDQGMPNSGFSSPFLGREAWTSPLPALLSSRTGCPIIVASTRRESGKYIIHYSDPIWPTSDPESHMRQVLKVFEKTVQERPHEWLWIHNRWKQQLPGTLTKHFRHDSLALIFPDNPDFLNFIPKIRALYPREQITAFVLTLPPFHTDIELHLYKHPQELFRPDYRFKMVIDFTSNPALQRHFSRLSALKTAAFQDPKEFLFHACQSVLS
jgi:KDO2-lipid IV(A) lauroyltransferase